MKIINVRMNIAVDDQAVKTALEILNHAPASTLFNQENLPWLKRVRVLSTEEIPVKRSGIDIDDDRCPGSNTKLY